MTECVICMIKVCEIVTIEHIPITKLMVYNVQAITPKNQAYIFIYIYIIRINYNDKDNGSEILLLVYPPKRPCCVTKCLSLLENLRIPPDIVRPQPITDVAKWTHCFVVLPKSIKMKLY